ncbi:caspase-8 [Nothobranchius furzeri]|uniref:Caspase-8 n=4 Tax=Nothobranchius TaxID=28779 RepID=A0A1A7ZG25_NOTFU|nr:caspase-8 [Nothobranchius furzeri]KAF7215806.1 caspase-8-like [Nothobranchius furzeri]
MDFHKLLLDVDNALGEDEFKALGFLCADFLSRNPDSVRSLKELFSSLMDKELLSEKQPQLLAELLLTIQKPRLLRDIGLSEQDCAAPSLISSYRKLLYDLSDNITDRDLDSMKFMLNNLIPRGKLKEKSTPLDIMLEMEHLDLISESNLDKLEEIFNHICPALNKKITQYKEKQAHRLRSLSFPSESNLISKPFLRTGSLQSPVTIKHDVLESKANLKNKTVVVPEPPRAAEALGKYQMTAANRGFCAIFNNNNFSNSLEPLKDRAGTHTDEDSLKKVFEWLNFEVEIYRDCEKEKMLSVLKDLRGRDHSQMDCLVCCVLSHGLEGSVYGVDGQTVKIEEMMALFDGKKCPTLVEKPKLFFIQACQGTREQRAAQTDGIETEDKDICSDARVPDTIPSRADFLLGMATVPSYVSYRDKKSGTWYIQSLCRNLIQMVPQEVDLISILTQVNADVSKMSADKWGQTKQMPQPAFSLRKRVVFPIPKTPPPELKTF